MKMSTGAKKLYPSTKVETARFTVSESAAEMVPRKMPAARARMETRGRKMLIFAFIACHRPVRCNMDRIVSAGCLALSIVCLYSPVLRKFIKLYLTY